MALFQSEHELLQELLNKWYAAIKDVTTDADRIFNTKGQMYDRRKPVWERVAWPYGFIHEITKKSQRVEQLATGYKPDMIQSVNWDEVEEELLDIMNYCRMFAAITRMLRDESMEEVEFQ